MGGTLSRIGEQKCVRFMRIPECKKRLGRPRRRWENNIKIYVKRMMMHVCELGLPD
jgi:hypothetical protein